ncbi:kinase-like protein [Sporormia fimetaria CBS 119925]|uniref:Kinase-like protein n=1 Tax=Sporormia fimetaria CBS 119925 TaxID=1340428 RepID=A0A6A6UV14_9PLEO|nr:kinase-like protein [Sporormia fimetaria CBS 119925]
MGETPQQWKSSERHYTLTSSTFTKRELRQDELPTSIYTGQVVEPRWSRERLRNEAATLQFIASQTTIPVPQFLGLYEADGLLYLATKRASGVPLDEISGPQASSAINRVDEYMNEVVLPQVRGLRRRTTGSVDDSLPVIPPSRVTYRDKRSHWAQKFRRDEDFVFCHNDLGQQNIMVDPDTFDITAIIDWEFAGFFPPEFELALWKHHWSQTKDDAQTDRLIQILDSYDEQNVTSNVMEPTSTGFKSTVPMDDSCEPGL